MAGIADQEAKERKDMEDKLAVKTAECETLETKMKESEQEIE